MSDGPHHCSVGKTKTPLAVVSKSGPAVAPTARRLWLYARIDVSWDRSGRLHVAEVEGTEPSLFFPDPTRPGVSPYPEN